MGAVTVLQVSRGAHVLWLGGNLAEAGRNSGGNPPPAGVRALLHTICADDSAALQSRALELTEARAGGAASGAVAGR